MKGIEFKIYKGNEIYDNNKHLLQQMYDACTSRDMVNEDILQYLSADDYILCMLKDDEPLGFSWLTFCESKHIAEICWLVTHKNKIKVLEGKDLLDMSIKYCQESNIKSVYFNCSNISWSNIKDKKSLFKRFGYKIKKSRYYDMGIDIREDLNVVP